MLNPITEFFTTLIGADIPKFIPLVFCLFLTWLILRSLMGITGSFWNGSRGAIKVLDITFIVLTITYCLIVILGGFTQWYSLPSLLLV